MPSVKNGWWFVTSPCQLTVVPVISRLVARRNFVIEFTTADSAYRLSRFMKTCLKFGACGCGSRESHLRPSACLCFMIGV